MKLLKQCRACIICILLFAGLFACKKTVAPTNEPLRETHVRLVSVDKAAQVAEQFDGAAFSKPGRHSTLSATTKRTIKSQETVNDRENIPAFYVFNYTDGGFVIVSADFNHEPIMAYVEDGALTRKDKITIGLSTWMLKTVSNVELLRQGLYDNTARAEKAWMQYLPAEAVKGSSPIFSSGTTPQSRRLFIIPPEPDIPCDQIDVTTIAPLVPYRWGQNCSFNDLVEPWHPHGCDFGCGNDRPRAGCVAVSMAQIIAYWQFPAWYNYSSMQVNYGVLASQQLIADVGLWVGTNYTCAGSSAYSGNAQSAFVNIYGYSGAIHSSYSYSSYMDVQSDISNGRPVLLSASHDAAVVFGFPVWQVNDSGHQWICDGWNSVTFHCPGMEFLYFNMNWGWNGYLDGWFGFNNWTVTHWNGAQWNFQYFKSYIHNIHP
jgi:hypothetical protein